MGYTNSSLVAYTKLSPNNSGERTHSIDRISPHCVVGQCSVETIGNIFAPTSANASSNYGIGPDGRIGMYVEEKNRSWCTSSRDNDQRAVTIECASGNTEPYIMYDVVYESLIKLCADICKRNGKTKLLWIADKEKALNYKLASDEMLITVHRWFANKSCPGNWLYSRLDDLAVKVTSLLGSVKELEKEEENTEPITYYRVQTGAYSNIANAVALQDRLKTAGFDTYLVKAEDGLFKVQTGAFKEYDNAYNLVKELNKASFASFITTKSGVPVISTNVSKTDLKKGDKVKMQVDAPMYNSVNKFQSWVYNTTLIVREITGNRVVVSTQSTGPVTGAVDKKYLTKI